MSGDTEKGRETMVGRFRKKPVEVEAIRYTGRNCHDVALFLYGEVGAEAWRDCGCDGDEVWLVVTLEGTMEARPGDWIVKGVQGEFYPCKPDIFAATYDEVPRV